MARDVWEGREGKCLCGSRCLGSFGQLLTCLVALLSHLQLKKMGMEFAIFQTCFHRVIIGQENTVKKQKWNGNGKHRRTVMQWNGNGHIISNPIVHAL